MLYKDYSFQTHYKYITDKATSFIRELSHSDFDRETPDRYALAMLEMLEGYIKPNINLKVFKSDKDQNFKIRIYNTEFTSICKHHFLPFVGTVDLVYKPRDRWVVGLSKIPRMIERISRKLWLQEDLTVAIGETFIRGFDEDKKPEFVAVSINAIHTCICSRGIKSNNKVGTYWETSI
jgi:GTP cyclohydrolase I